MDGTGARASIADIRAALQGARGRSATKLLAELAEDERPHVRRLVQATQARLEVERAEHRRLSRLYRLERQLEADGFSAIVGVDEVGRGCLAGPVTAGAVVLPIRPYIEGLNDSKALTRIRRERVAERVWDVALCAAVGHASAVEIDALGMTRALRLAMSRALSRLGIEPDIILVDGNPIGIAPGEMAIVDGDAKVAAIAAASVIAKVTRDDLMRHFDRLHPHYGFAEHKGYSTPEHFAAIEARGVCALHRRSFAPCYRPLSLF